MEKFDKKQVTMVLVFEIAILFFLINNVFIPLSKKNSTLLANLNEVRSRVSGIRSAYDSSRVEQIKKDISELDVFLSTSMPEEKNVTGLTRILSSSDVSISSISSGPSENRKFEMADSQISIPYEVLHVSISMKTNLNSFLRYFTLVRSQERLISIKKMILSPDPNQQEGMNALIDVEGYVLPTQNIPFVSVDEEHIVDMNHLSEILTKPVRTSGQSSFNNLSELFPAVIKISPPEIVNIPTMLEPPKPVIEPTLILTGIVIKQGQSIAIINNKLFKLSADIEGYVLTAIEGDHVVLQKDGKEKILKIQKILKGDH